MIRKKGNCGNLKVWRDDYVAYYSKTGQKTTLSSMKELGEIAGDGAYILKRIE